MAAATMYVVPGGAGVKDGTTWAKAFSEVELQADLEGGAGGVEAGDIYYIAEGTYTCSAAWDCSAVTGTAAAPITFIGVKTGTSNEPPVLADWSDANLSGGADDRPIIDAAANVCHFGDCFKFYNIIFKSTTTSGIDTETYPVCYNCKFIGESGSNDRPACNNSGGYLVAVLCEFCGTVANPNCRGITGYSRYTSFGCWYHDCRTGVASVSNPNVLFGVFEDCSVAAMTPSATGVTVIGVNNTINDCAIGFNMVATGNAMYINNLLEGCTTSGFTIASQLNNIFFLNNHGNDVRNTDMWVNCATTLPHCDLNNTSGDPLFDGDGNLSLQSGSPCINAGASAVLGT